jgi:large subunit ribosomal protein L9
MKLLLRSDVAGLGHKGDVVEVANGYGRNYLVPRGLAMVATAGAERQAEAMRRSRKVRDTADRAAAEDIARVLVPAVVTIEARAGAEGKLFGSVTTSEVADAVAEQFDIDIDRRNLHVDDAIREVGTHSVQARLHADVQFSINVEVVAADG